MKTTMKLTESCIEAKVPCIIWGPPGVGKTAMVELIAERKRAVLFTPTINDPSDIALPIPRETGHEMSPAQWARRAIELSNSREVIIFLDELTTKAPAIQSAMLRFLDSGKIGDYQIPGEVARVAAANSPELAGYHLKPTTANRLVHLEFEIDHRDWVEWMLAQSSRYSTLQVFTEVASFINHRPDLLFAFPGSEIEHGKAWPSPRSWFNGCVAVSESGIYEDEFLTSTIFRGSIGDGALAEFWTWKQQSDLPDPEWLLEDPERFELPSRGDIQFAVLASIVTSTIRHLTKERWQAAWTILGKAADEGAPDVGAVAVSTLISVLTEGRFGKDNMSEALQLASKHIKKYDKLVTLAT